MFFSYLFSSTSNSFSSLPISFLLNSILTLAKSSNWIINELASWYQLLERLKWSDKNSQWIIIVYVKSERDCDGRCTGSLVEWNMCVQSCIDYWVWQCDEEASEAAVLRRTTFDVTVKWSPSDAESNCVETLTTISSFSTSDNGEKEATAAHGKKSEELIRHPNNEL